MNEILTGRFFLPGSSRFLAARATLADGELRIEDQTGKPLGQALLDTLTISPRLGNLPRRFTLADGACFETEDNEAADRLLTQKHDAGGLIHRLEQSWRWAAASVVLAGAVVYLFVAFGIPTIALWLARETPPSANAIITTQTLQVLDRTLLSPSKLDAANARKAQLLFAQVAALGKKGAGGYRLLPRSSPQIGPNALALPDGTIVMTDELWSMVKADDEIEGVFAHEIAHVDRAHSLQSLYQAAMVPAAIALVTGDLSQISQIATLLPGLLVQAAYSRGFEQQADDDAVTALNHLGGNPAHLADLLQRLDTRLCGKSGCQAGWLGTHPETGSRVMRLRNSAPAGAAR